MVGDLKYGRTVHSLARLLAAYGGRDLKLNFVSPASLPMLPSIVASLRASGIAVTETASLDEAIGSADVIYWTRVQQERFAAQAEYEKVSSGFIMKPALMARAKPEAILLHPLPRKHEMGGRQDHDVLDRDRRSIYFQQMENGMLVRMALLAKVLKDVHI